MTLSLMALSYLSQAQNSGIGTSNPQSKLEIVADAPNDATKSALNVKDNVGNSLLFLRNDGKVGIGINNPSAVLDIIGKEINATYEGLFTVRLENSRDASYNFDYFGVTNGTNENNRFAPVFSSGYFSGSNQPCLYLIGQTTPTNDVGGQPIVHFNARLTSPISKVTTRPLFRWTNNGTTKMLMDAKGNVGIGDGINSMSAQLQSQLTGTAIATSKTAYFNNTNTSSTASITKYGLDIQSTGTWNGASATNIGLNVNATGGTTNYAALFSGGNVGIGTTIPEDKLQVGTGPYKLVTGSASGANLGYGTGYLAFNASRQNTSTWSTANDGTNNGGAVMFGNVFGDIYFSTLPTTGATNQTGITDATVMSKIKVAITKNGNVGIGTTAPSAKLSISNGGDDPTNYGRALQITNANGNSQQMSFIRQGMNVVSLGYYGATSIWGIGGGQSTDANFAPNWLCFDIPTNYVGLGTTTPKSTLDIKGSESHKLISVSANYTAANENVIVVNAGSNVTISLPDASTINNRTYIIKKWLAANTVTIQPYGMQLIEGASTKVLTAQYEKVTIINDGSNWVIIGN